MSNSIEYASLTALTAATIFCALAQISFDAQNSLFLNLQSVVNNTNPQSNVDNGQKAALPNSLASIISIPFRPIMRANTVKVVSENGVVTSNGSGGRLFFPGLISTASHVVLPDGQTMVSVTGLDPYRRAIPIYNNPQKDMALLYTPSIIPGALTNRNPRLGQTVYAVGFPESRLGQKILTEGNYKGMLSEDRFSFSAPVSPGSSGGPVYDIFGREIGVVQGVNTATKGPYIGGILRF